MKKIINKISDLSLLWKFTIIYFLLIILPIFAIANISYKQAVKSMQDQSDRTMNDIITQLKYDISNKIINAENIAEEIVFSGEVKAFLNNEFDFNDKEVDYFIYSIQNKLIKIKHLYPNAFLKIRIFSSNQSIEETYDIIYSIDKISNKDYYNNILNSKSDIYWGNIKEVEEYYDINKNINPKPNFNMVIPLYKKITPVISTKVIGVLEIDILTEKMFGDFSLDKGEILIVNINGEIINNTKNNQFQEYIDINDLSDSKGKKSIYIGDEKYRVVYDTLDHIDYKIVSIVSQKELLERTQGYKNSLIIFTLIGISGIFFIIYFTTNLLFKCFKEMTKMMKRIRNGEFDVRIDESKKDEIGELAFNFNKMAEKLQKTISNLIDKETAHRDAEIRALQSQINPHFLYNALESIRMECELKEEFEIADVLTSFGKLFRYSIKWSNAPVLLRQEIDHIRNYIIVMKMRFRNKINFKTDILADELLDCYVLKMVLQPLVENCFKHGFKDKEGIWNIEIKCYQDNNNMYIQIIDNGTGINEQRLYKIRYYLNSKNKNQIDQKTEGFVGLWNVDRRIKIQYGVDYGLKIVSKENEGTKVIVTMPIISI